MPFQKQNYYGGGYLPARMQAFRLTAIRSVSKRQVKALMKQYLGLAMKGDLKAAQIILPYILGKPVENVQLAIEQIKLYDQALPLDDKGP